LAFFASYETNILVDGVYTFGEPRTGNEAFLECHDRKLRTKTFRFINNRDVVARVPPFGGYIQLGNLIYFDRNENISVRNVNDGLFDMTLDVVLFKFATNHFKENYQLLVDKYKKINPFISKNTSDPNSDN
jgi:triacylglycerol lipase